MRPRASSWNGYDSSVRQIKTNEQACSKQTKNQIIKSSSAENKNYKLQGSSLVVDAPLKKPSSSSSARNMSSSPRARRHSDLGLLHSFQAASRENEGDSSRPVAPRRGSVAAVMGITLFKKLYYARLHVQARKETEVNTKIHEIVSAEERDSENDDDVTIDDNDLTREGTRLLLGCSGEARAAYLECYKDKLRTGLENEYPECKNKIYRDIPKSVSQ